MRWPTGSSSRVSDCVHSFPRQQPPITLRMTSELLHRMPLAAVRDLAEWEHDARPSEAASSYLNTLQELSLGELIAAAPKTDPIPWKAERWRVRAILRKQLLYHFPNKRIGE